MKHFTTELIDSMDKRYRAMFINSLTGFKSVALIGTKSNTNLENLAIFNSLVHLGAHPPLIGLVIRPDSVDRHTLENILESNYYTINQIKEEFFEKAHQTSARYPKGKSEFEATGLTPIYKDDFTAPFVAESSIQFGVEFKERIDLKINGTVFIVGQIQQIYLPESIIHEDGFVDLSEAGTITNSGLDSYHRTEKISRLPYAKPLFSE